MLLPKLLALGLGSSIAAGILALCFGPDSGVVLPRDPERWRAQLEAAAELPEAREMRERILGTLAAPGVPAWAGDYVNSDGFVSLRLTLGSEEYVYEHSHCTGVGELSYGTVESVDGARVLLRPAFHVRPDEPAETTSERRSAFAFERELVVVTWNLERFLVPESQMPEFCRLVHAPRWASMRYASYPRLGEEFGGWNFFDSDLAGLPDVPEEHRHLLPAE